MVVFGCTRRTAFLSLLLVVGSITLVWFAPTNRPIDVQIVQLQRSLENSEAARASATADLRALQQQVRSATYSTSQSESAPAGYAPKSGPTAENAKRTALAKPDVATLQDFNDQKPNVRSVVRRYDMGRKPMLCFLRIMTDAAIPIWAWQGTTLAAFRGWNAPWDHDLDFAVADSPGVAEVLERLWKPYKGIQVNSVFPECEGLEISSHGDLIYIGQTEFNVWRLQTCTPGDKMGCTPGEEADWLCGWICIPRSEIFPTQLVGTAFYEPPTNDGEEYSLGKVVNLPAMRNITSFMDRYKPYKTARTQSSYNYYNVTLGQWTFDMQTYYNYRTAGGPPIVLGPPATANDAPHVKWPSLRESMKCVCEHYLRKGKCSAWSEMSEECRLNKVHDVDRDLHAQYRDASMHKKDCSWCQETVQ